MPGGQPKPGTVLIARRGAPSLRVVMRLGAAAAEAAPSASVRREKTATMVSKGVKR